MLSFVIRKIINKRWMVAALFVGSLLLIGITAANPMYTGAALQRMLDDSFAESMARTGRYPLTVTVKTSGYYSNDTLPLKTDQEVDTLAESYGLPIIQKIRFFQLSGDRYHSSLERPQSSWLCCPAMLDGLSDHITLIEGTGMSSGPDADGIVDAVISEAAMVKQKLLLGEVISFDSYTWADGTPLRLRIAGVFTNSMDRDPYWVARPAQYTEGIFIDEQLFCDNFFNKGYTVYGMTGTWYVLYDYTNLNESDVDRVVELTNHWNDELSQGYGRTFATSFLTTLEDYQKTAAKLKVTLLVLQVPVFVLLAAFILMVSRRMFEMEQAEIAVLRSRGAGRGQVIGIYLMQSLITSAAALAAGIPFAWFLVQVLGSSNSFLEFVGRRALSVRVTPLTVYCVCAAFLFSVLAMVLPSITRSGETIVSHEQKKGRRAKLLSRGYAVLTFAVLFTGLYGLYSYNNQKDYLASRVVEGASPDPLLYLSSALFMLGAGMLVLLLFPLFIKALYRLFGQKMSPALYTSFVKIMRSADQKGIMLFLIITIALGVFDASAARTINSNNEQNIRYLNGTDIVVQEKWKDNAEQVANDPNLTLVYTEPDYSRYSSLEGAESITKVQITNNCRMYVDKGTLEGITVMGIHTKEFGQTARFDESLISPHWFEYLNAMAQHPLAVLLSDNFREDYGIRLGDVIYYRNNSGESATGVVYGFVDYWPTYARTAIKRGTDGLYTEKKNYLIVANLGQLQSYWGVTPYQIWMRSSGSSRFIYDFAEQNGINYKVFRDTSADIVESRNDPLIQGTNGMLTVGFIVALALCAVGFLIYWILSIRERELQFGIFRAMGMSMKEIVTMLVNEHVFISGIPVAAGVAVGMLTSKLYMPLIQIAYATIDTAVPLRVVHEAGDMIKLGIVVGAMIVVCLVILGTMVRRMKIAQALKMGE
ncbi:MAG: FtsX-like permease family protein [Lachnospiraceae bacterium]|nr:FtsX-like permease family protein [Lachnospiraceae bacterium]